ncbi:MAG: sugar transferase [Clostridia bacterium]
MKKTTTTHEVQRQGGFFHNVAGTKTHKKSKYLKIKRGVDVFCATVALVMLTPLFIIVMLAICLESKGHPIYNQVRVGKDGREFKFYKFRSMCQNADSQLETLMELNERDGPAFKLDNDPRITKVGAIIRKTCIDELPQLWNIIKGDMSIVGPRPPLPQEVLIYSNYHKQRLSVVPGLTCWWQVQKGEDTTFEEWVEMDIKYINDISFLLDLKLIFKTLGVVLLGKGDK